MNLVLQYAVVALAVLGSTAYVLQSRAPQLSRRLRVALALALIRESRPDWLRALGRRIAPSPQAATCGGCSSGCSTR